jgi:large subunit ribosomal protein L24
VCKTCGQPTRVGHRTEDGKKTRVCKKCGADL